MYSRANSQRFRKPKNRTKKVNLIHKKTYKRFIKDVYKNNLNPKVRVMIINDYKESLNELDKLINHGKTQKNC